MAILRSSSSISSEIKDEMAIIRNSSTKTGEFVDEMRVYVGRSPISRCDSNSPSGV